MTYLIDVIVRVICGILFVALDATVDANAVGRLMLGSCAPIPGMLHSRTLEPAI
jgi:hypothetical protein